jgi:hypothetical protein
LSEEAIAAIRAGKAVTSDRHGLRAVADDTEAPALRLYVLKGWPESMPCALLAADQMILDNGPSCAAGRRSQRGALPGPYNVLPNPARRFRWLCGASRGDQVRVPELPRRPAPC